MKAFDALTYKDQKGSFNNEDEQLLLSLLKGTSGKVLDIGCGDGLLTVQAKESMPEAQIVAIDNSPEQIQLATKNDAEGIEFAEADITNLSREEIFDGAYSFYAFPHIPKSKIPSALVSVRNVLKPGGKFYLFTNISKEFAREFTQQLGFDWDDVLQRAGARYQQETEDARRRQAMTVQKDKAVARDI
jgi:ubiquinone/menaquinone biosynthesis C-methylase UbiE